MTQGRPVPVEVMTQSQAANTVDRPAVNIILLGCPNVSQSLP